MCVSRLHVGGRHHGYIYNWEAEMTDTYAAKIEKVARAICDASLWAGSWEKANEIEREACRHEARAALAALPDTAPAPAISSGEMVSVEDCAKLCDEIYDDAPNGSFDNGGTQDGWQMACREVERRIRALAAAPAPQQGESK
jgi:hypothetical protein